LKLRWSADAVIDRLAILNFIMVRDDAAARQLDAMFETRAVSLVTFPKLGRPGRIAGTRELTVHRNYRLVYEIGETTIIVLNIVHASRNWPPVEPSS
jgi:toxin ParE1/3/4